MPAHLWHLDLRRAAITLAVLLAAASFAPWWKLHSDGSETSAWTGPHLSWVAVLLCLAIAAARSLPNPAISGRWAALGTAAALAITGWGWLAEHAQSDAAQSFGLDHVTWVLHDQGAPVGSTNGPFDTAWGYPVGLCLMLLLLTSYAVATTLDRRHER